MVIPTFSPDLTNERADTRYPYLEVLDRSEPLALVLSSLERGDLPVVFSRETDKIEIVAIRVSAKTLNVLVKVTRLVLHTAPDTSMPITDTDSIMKSLALMKGT